MAWHSITLELEATQADAFADALLGVAASVAGFAAPEYRAARLEDEDWVRRSQAQFAPLRVGDRLRVVPSWHAPPDPGAIVPRVDPGLAFGTGSHPSTHLALAYLEKRMRANERVLDYGCGSGILAIAAAKLGAGEVVAVAVDAQASGSFDLVLANILSSALIALEPLLAARTRRGGRIVLSGILETQCAEVAAAYAPDFAIAAVAAEEGWALVEGRRK